MIALPYRRPTSYRDIEQHQHQGSRHSTSTAAMVKPAGTFGFWDARSLDTSNKIICKTFSREMTLTDDSLQLPESVGTIYAGRFWGTAAILSFRILDNLGPHTPAVSYGEHISDILRGEAGAGGSGLLQIADMAPSSPHGRFLQPARARRVEVLPNGNLTRMAGTPLRFDVVDFFHISPPSLVA